MRFETNLSGCELQKVRQPHHRNFRWIRCDFYLEPFGMMSLGHVTKSIHQTAQANAGEATHASQHDACQATRGPTVAAFQGRKQLPAGYGCIKNIHGSLTIKPGHV